MILAATLVLILALVAHSFDEYLRRTLESKINQSLHGYHVALGHAHLSPLGLGLTLRQVVIRQDANPEPPVASIPRLKTSVEWGAILTGHLVADAVFIQPRVHVNLPQLEAEAKDPTKLKERGWQQAFESIYPLKFNLIQVRDGDLVYIDKDPKWPFHVSHWNATASNIRNIQSHKKLYPSAIHTEGVVFDTGRASLDGHADFLSVPYPGVHAFYKGQNIPLDRLRPFGERANLTLTGGTLSSRGEVEYGPKHREARIADVIVRDLRLDYIHTTATATAEKARGKKVGAEVKKVAENPEPPMPVEVRSLRLIDGNLGLVTPAKDRRVRLFVNGANLDVTNLSTGFQKGPVKVALAGRFMGSGSTHGAATFRDARKGADFDLHLAVDGASLPSINDLLRAYGKFDVSQGTFLPLYRDQGPRRPRRRLPEAAVQGHPGLRSQAGREEAGAQKALRESRRRGRPRPGEPQAGGGRHRGRPLREPLGAQHQHLGDHRPPGLERLRQGDPPGIRAGIQGGPEREMRSFERPRSLARRKL